MWRALHTQDVSCNTLVLVLALVACASSSKRLPALAGALALRMHGACTGMIRTHRFSGQLLRIKEGADDGQ